MVPQHKQQRLQLATLCLASFLAALNYFATTPFFPMIARDLRTTVPLLGQAITLMLVVSSILGLVAGPLADAYGYRRLLTLGMGAIAANMLGVAIAHSYPVLLALSLIGAIGDALVFGLALALASVLFEGAAKRRAISWTIASLSVGAIAGVPVLTVIGDRFGWRVAIACVGIAAFTIAGLTFSAFPPDRIQSDGRPTFNSLKRSYAPLRHSWPALRLLSVTVLRCMWFLGSVTYLGAYLADERGLTTKEVGLAYLVAGIGSTTGSIVAGTRWLGSNVRQVISASNLLGGCLLSLMFVVSNPGVALTLLTGGAFLASFAGVAIATLLTVESPAQPGTTMALNASLVNAGAAAGAGIGGGLIALGGYMPLAIGLLAYAVAAALLTCWPIRFGRFT